MLLTAKLFRSTSRSFKTFPSNRIGENANSLISTETKSRNSKETETSCTEETPSYSGLTCHPQLEVNTSNLKFRKCKSKKKESEQEAGIDVAAEERRKETVLKKSSVEELSKLLLGDSKSDFEQWLEGSRSIQAANKSDSVHETKNICDNQDSLISSCNASDCSEEDKEDKSRTMVGEWNESKLCETSGKVACDGECKVDDFSIPRSSYSSGCHSMTASSSSVVSDSEGASPSCDSPHRDVFNLQNELNLKMVDIPTSQFICNNDVVFKLPEVESQFQVVQSKKKMKLKSKSGEANNLDKSAYVAINPLRNDSGVTGDSKKQKKKHHSVHDIGSGDDVQPTEVVDLQPASLSVDRSNVSVIPQQLTAELIAPKHVSLPGIKPSYSAAPKGDRWNVAKGGKKAKQDKKEQTITLENGVKTEFSTIENDATPAENFRSSAETETTRKSSRPLVKTEKILEKKSDDSTSRSATKTGPEVISFGSSCKDLDTFTSPLSTSNNCQHESTERRKFNGMPSTDRQSSRSKKHQFNLRQAQKFLLNAYDAVQKQRNEDSNSVFVYS